MSKAIGLDKERELAAAKAAEAAEMEMAVAADKIALQGEQTRSKVSRLKLDQPALCSHTTALAPVQFRASGKTKRRPMRTTC